MKYIVIFDSHYEDFAAKVNRQLEKGWSLVGGVAVRTNDEGYPVLYQAMVKVISE